MPRILVINPFPLDEAGVARRAAQSGHVALDPDTELVYRPVRFSAVSFMSPHAWLMMDLGVYEAGLTAEQAGLDAVVIDRSEKRSVGKESVSTCRTLGATDKLK